MAPPPLAPALTVGVAPVGAAEARTAVVALALDTPASSDVAIPVDATAAGIATVRMIGRLPHDLDVR